MFDMTEAHAALNRLLVRGVTGEGPYQKLLERYPELIPTFDVLNHGVQWEAVISKFKIADDRITDLAFVTKSSDTWRAVLIELESPSKKLFRATGHTGFHNQTRLAIDQIEDWRGHAKRNLEDLQRRFKPLMDYPVMFRDNPVEIASVLVIGRNPHGYTPRQAERVKQMREEGGIRIITWDTLLRHALERQHRRWRYNVLSHSRSGFKFKHAYSHTSMFADFRPSEIKVDAKAAGFFRNNGYDIDEWLDGKLLEYDQGRLAKQRSFEEEDEEEVDRYRRTNELLLPYEVKNKAPKAKERRKAPRKRSLRQ